MSLLFPQENLDFNDPNSEPNLYQIRYNSCMYNLTNCAKLLKVSTENSKDFFGDSGKIKP